MTRQHVPLSATPSVHPLTCLAQRAGALQPGATASPEATPSPPYVCRVVGGVMKH